MKKLISIFAVLLLTLVFTVPAAAAEQNTVTLSTAPEVYAFIPKKEAALSITEGVLHYPHEIAGYEEPVVDNVPVFFVAISDSSQTISAEKAADLIWNSIPKGSNLFLVGHGRGGETAQLLAADSRMKENYHILNALTFGSPKVRASGQEGRVIRLVEKYDRVASSLFDTASRESYLSLLEILEKGGDADISNTSYADPKTWGQYDVVGRTDHTTTLTLYPDTAKTYSL